MAVIQPEYFCELPRYRTLDRYRKYYDSKQYEGRPDFFTGLKPGDANPVPLRARKPCIIYPLPRAAVNQVVRFTFGESRFPTISVEKIEKDNAVAGESLSEEDAKTVETFVKELIDRCHIKPAMRRVMRPGLAVGTVVGILSLKRGCFDLQVANAEDVVAEFRDGDPSSDVVRAVWAYQYEDSVPGRDEKPETKRFWFRQDITDTEFIHYERLEVKQGERPKWRVERTIPHGFGFCPVVWVRNFIESDSRQIDGVSLFDNLLEEFDALNFALSQRHRGINYWGTPQPWETGVEDDDGPSAKGRTSGFSSSTTKAPNDESPHGRVAELPARPAGPANMWTYRNENAKVGVFETTGKAFEAGTLHVNDIRSRALESMSVVLVNVSDIMGRTQQGQMSAKFLELAYEPLLALVDEMRHLWWPAGLERILSMALRIVATLKGEGIYIPRAAKVAKILEGFVLETTDGKLWMPPKMTPLWGDYFSPGPEEIGKVVDTAAKAQEARLVPEKDAVKSVLPYFGREDVDNAIEEIEEDKIAAQEQALQQAEQEAKTLHAMAGGGKGAVDDKSGGSGGALKGDDGKQPGGSAKPRRGKSKADPEGGSGARRAAASSKA